MRAVFSCRTCSMPWEFSFTCKTSTSNFRNAARFSVVEHEWLFANLRFSTDACMIRGRVTCLDKSITFAFPDFVLSAATHISALELFTIIVAVKIWVPILQHQQFIISCDNEAAVTIITAGSPRDSFMQSCLRELWFLSAINNFDIRAWHIPGEHNSLADACIEPLG